MKIPSGAPWAEHISAGEDFFFYLWGKLFTLKHYLPSNRVQVFDNYSQSIGFRGFPPCRPPANKFGRRGGNLWGRHLSLLKKRLMDEYSHG